MADIPKIRFKGFTEPWEQRKLGEVFKEYSEKNHTELPALTIIRGGGTVKREESDRNLMYDESNLSNYKMVRKDDFIVHLRSFEGGLEKSLLDGIISPAYHTFHSDVADSRFYYPYFRSHEFIKHKLVPHVYGIRDGRSIDIAGMKTIEIPYTSIEEQRKIGDYLESLDHLITLHQRKCDDTKKLKKYMLQKMFPKNGEKFPKIRFKGFTEAWEQRKLGEVLKERTERAKGDEELLSVTIANGVIRQIDSEKRNTASEDRSNYKIVKKGDVPYNSMRMWQGAVGNSKYNGIVSPAYTILTPTSEANGKFFMELFKKKSTLQIFQRWSQGLTSDTWNLKYPILSSIQFAIPSVEEQEKIAEYFSSLDHLITLHQRKCDTLKELKKYMLQNMFPKKG
ncbi:MAG: restriction endonuclease subunit S [Eubacterium sp.]|uniref:restriction endonuclease subunit S n=1 Tax=Eubacterium sp. TaxID=142586 RepID=UPI00399949C9